MTIQEAIQTLIRREIARVEVYAVLCRVVSVDSNDRTCEVEPLNGNASLYDVRFQAEIGMTEGIYVEPAVDSTVLVAFINNTQAAVIQYSEVDNIYIDTSGDTIFNGGNNGGMVKVADLVTKLNNIENDLNTVKAAFSGWTPVPNDGGASLKTATAVWAANTLTLTTQNDLKNDKVKH
jgi:hypothetical protein